MITKLAPRTVVQLLCFCWPFLSSYAIAAVDTPTEMEEETVAQTSQAETADLNVSPQLQHELTQVLYCYTTGVDFVGAGDVQSGANEFEKCFTDDAVSVYIFPPAYASFNFTINGGGQSMAQTVLGVYQSLGIVRTQHMMSNIRITRTGKNTAVMRSYLIATHVFANESALNITAHYVDHVRRINGK